MKFIRIYNTPVRRIFGNRKNLLILWGGLVVLAKIIRYTILKVTLVDAGIGHSMITLINTHNTAFVLFDGGVSSDATGNAVYFYDKLNILGFSSYISFEIAITFIWNILLMFLMNKCQKKYDELQAVFLVVSILALNIFDFTLAKEPIQILFFIFIFYILVSNSVPIQGKWIWSIICIVASVFTFRIYYILMLIWAIVFSLIYRFCITRRINFGRLLLILFNIAIVYVAMIIILQYVSLESYIELIRVRTRQSSATTDIRALFDSGNLFLFSINYILVVIRILFPVELLRFGVKYAIYVGVQVTMSLVYMKALYNIADLNKSEQIALYLFSGFILMSAFFEPDFGSWIRHEAAAFPLLLILSGVSKVSE